MKVGGSSNLVRGCLTPLIRSTRGINGPKTRKESLIFTCLQRYPCRVNLRSPSDCLNYSPAQGKAILTECRLFSNKG